MAQAYAAYPQNRGTLPPGQTILVNNYTIQVEKYLSQGGFAHVYLVRSATPINNTTQHVLKRIAVSDGAMLSNVKKEVDIMRLLRGHPNIVNFIDASWHALPNGAYEVFILMELCAGGGIIDMMNRRLRERLTEAEILQIFVDVCEAVAAMHNLKPALLHRDLKVENILQSSPTRYKLCDFGSSTPVHPRPPSSLQEIRLLEADLNRHTTLQYRAPEMVDVHLRRPVDEKSDVWALGVLLYKLCYYTTPFEEHGPLAILNVQYKIPPYPVYSPQINSLIASMLRELGSQRPSAFEVLSLVHRMRGTKSPYRYEIPSAQSLRPALQESTSSGMESLVSFRTSPTPGSNVTAAAQARQTVLEAIAPMRRGRPTATTVSTSSVDSKQEETPPDVRKFEEQWNAVRATRANQAADDAWHLRSDKVKTSTVEGLSGFGDSFVDPPVVQSTPALTPSSSAATSRKVASHSLSVQKDAFDGLGGISRSREPSPTLAEAAHNPKSNGSGSRPPHLNGISRTPIPAASSSPLSPRIPASRTGLATYHPPAPLSAEERFPSLDELDKSWRTPLVSQNRATPFVSQLEAESKSNSMAQPRTEVYNSPPSGVSPSEFKTAINVPLRGEARSQQVTGTAMRNDQVGTVPFNQASRPATSNMEPMDKRQLPIGSVPTKYRPTRPALARRHRSSMSIKLTEPLRAPQDWLTGDDSVPVNKSSTESPPSPLKQCAPATLSSTPSKVSSDGSGSTKPLVQDTDARIPETATPYGENGGAISSVTTDSRSEFTSFKYPPMHAPRHVDEVHETSRRQDSSDDAEGPEDVNGRVMDNDRKRRAKGRQSSVHDLVDLYGGGARSPMDRERTGLPSPVLRRQGRRTSGILIDLSLPPSTSSAPEAPQVSTLLSPASIVPESRAELASRRSGSGSREEHTSPASSPTQLAESNERSSRPASRASPDPAANRGNRPRPQSMFVFPSKPSKDPPSNVKALGAPRPRASRRGSISDMVDLYENLGSRATSKNPPPLASKPMGMKSTKTPSPITSRFPPVSPSGVSFSADQVTSLLFNAKSKPKQRTLTATSFGDFNSPGPSAPEITKTKEDFVSRVPRRQSVSPHKRTTGPLKAIPPAQAPSKPIKPPSLSIPKIPKPTLPNSSPRTPVAETPITSPSPERPYQGVGKLIDQWQRKTEEADASWRPGPRAPGRPAGPRVAPGKAGKGD